MGAVLEEAGGVLALVGLFAAIPIGGAAKLAKVSVPVAFLAWAIYFGAFVVWMRIEGPNWTQAFGWTMILNIFTGLGVLPTTLVAWIINKVARR